MAQKTSSFYEFGSFRLEPSEQLLLRNRLPVSLPPKTFNLLVFLVQNHGRLVTKDQIMQAVWPESFVEEANLTVSISALRKVLGEKQGGPRCIETVPKRGYRFATTVREVAWPPEAVHARIRDVPPARKAPEETQASQAISSDSPVQAATQTSVPEPAVPLEAEVSAGPQSRKRWLVLAMLAVLSVVVVITGYLRFQPSSEPASLGPRSLGVLPFQNVGQDASSDFLGFSLADAVITKLGYVSSLSVRPSSSVEKYRNQPIDIRKVAADLNVDALLTGNFIRDGDDFRITPQLVDARTEKILWRGTIDLKYDHLLTVQDNVAQQIIKGLELSLSRSQSEQLVRDEPVDPLAYEYYLRGVDLYSRNDFPMAVKMLERSAQIGPKYALTWAQLGRSYAAAASLQFGGRQNYDKAQAAYEKALAIQPGQIEAQIFMANLLTDTGRVERAVPMLRDVLKTNPNLSEAHWELGYAYRFGGMLPESVAEGERARQLDPGVKLNSSALNAYLYLGQYDRFLHSLPENSDSAFVIFYRGLAEYCKKDWGGAAADFDRAFQIDPSLLPTEVGKAYSYAIADQNGKALEILRGTEAKIQQRGVTDAEGIYKIAEAYAVLGEKSAAMRTLSQSIQKGFFPYPYFVSDPLLDNIRHEEGFDGLLKTARERQEAFKSAFF